MKEDLVLKKKIISIITASAILATSMFSIAFAYDGSKHTDGAENNSLYFADKDSNHGKGHSVTDSVYGKHDNDESKDEDREDKKVKDEHKEDAGLNAVTVTLYTYSQTQTPAQVVDTLLNNNVSLRTIAKAVNNLKENNGNKYPDISADTLNAYSAAILAKLEAQKTEIQAKIDAIQELTDLYDKMGDLEKAINMQKKAIMTDYKNILSYKKIGEIFNKKGDKEIKVFTVGEQVYFKDTQPVIKNDRTMVPIRAISESLKADVQWDEATQTVIITKDGVVIKLVLNSDVATINGVEVKLDAPAESINDRIIVPVRFISEAFKSTVQWEPDSQIVVIY
jgi:Copper amine oxidase N-terminal domain.